MVFATSNSENFICILELSVFMKRKAENLLPKRKHAARVEGNGLLGAIDVHHHHILHPQYLFIIVASLSSSNRPRSQLILADGMVFEVCRHRGFDQ